MYLVENNEITTCTAWDAVDYLETIPEICLDIETEDLIYPRGDRILVVTVGDDKKQFVLPVTEETIPMIKMVLCELQNKIVIGQYLLFDLTFIRYWFGCNVSAWTVYDTYQQECIFTKGDIKSDKRLDFLLESYLNIKIDKSLQQSFKYGEELTKDQVMYCALDIKFLPALKEKQLELKAEFISEGLGTERLYQLENDLTPAIAQSLANGITFDLGLHEINTNKAKDMLGRLHTAAMNYLKTKFVQYKLGDTIYSKDFTLTKKEDVRLLNLDSPKQLLTLIKQFDPTVQNTRKETLAKYMKQGSNQDLVRLLNLLSSYKLNAKTVSTYGEKFATTVHIEDGRPVIRTSIGQNLTTTGRLISSDVASKDGHKNFVNLQNIPSSGEMRECFIGRPGYSVCTLDLAGCELRILASQSGDPVLTEGMAGTRDFHSELAQISHRIITGNPEYIVTASVNKHLRKGHKPVLFGIIYDARAPRISSILNVSKPIANKIYKALTSYLKPAFDYLNRYATTSMKNGFAVANEVTRRFYILSEYTAYEMAGQQHPDTARIRRQMFNFPMQGTNADMMKSIFVNVSKYFNTIPEYDCRILMSVYDELVFEVPEDCPELANKVKQIAIETANEFLSNGVVMECELHVGPYWKK